jgi:NadR type nicotinamide-nucleotide adenylyltransferase
MLSKRLGSGLVFGKFMPLHEGHLHLLHFAQSSCHRLTIVVCSVQAEPIPGEIRYQWMRQMFPSANVVHHYVELPQDPSGPGDDAFWRLWRDSLRRHCPDEEFDALFGSEDYGWRMARELGIEYIPVNRERTLVPVSGTQIRAEPMRHWDYIPTVVRPHFVKRIAVIGPECCGKSTLVKRLATVFRTSHIDEYARRYMDEHHRSGLRTPDAHGKLAFAYDDLPNIARGQMVTEDAMAFNANRIIFCDTDLLTTWLWTNHYFGRCEEWIRTEGLRRRYDVTLLTDPRGLPYESDHLRSMPDLDQRVAMFESFRDAMAAHGRPYRVLHGSWQEREADAVAIARAIVGLE